MMCEHEFESYDKQVRYLERTFIKSELASMVVDSKQQLAAVNARIAELEKSNKKWSIVVDDLKQLSETDKQRAEQAEAKLSEAQATIDTHNEMIERQHSEIFRLNELLERNNCRMIALEDK